MGEPPLAALSKGLQLLARSVIRRVNTAAALAALAAWQY